MTGLLPSELTLNSHGKVYHLDIGPDDIADTIVLVGDPARVQLVASRFDSVRFKTQNREFYTSTGLYKGREITVMSTGIGTDNVDIVLNELDAAVNIDLKTRKIRDQKRKLNLLRIGTCGALQADLPPGSLIISEFAIGLDGLAGFYSSEGNQPDEGLVKLFSDACHWPQTLAKPYVTCCDMGLRNLLGTDIDSGITITSSGFYGPQGRKIRLSPSITDFQKNVAPLRYKGLRFVNLEMETSALYFLASELGHAPLTICLAVANRMTGDFLSDYHQQMNLLVEKVLDKLSAH